MQKLYHYPHSKRTQTELAAMADRYESIKLPEVVAAFALTNLNLTPVRIRKPESYGTSHVIYIVDVKERDKPVIFRGNIGYGKEPEAVLLTEKLVTDAVSKAGVPVNRILFVDITRRQVPFDFQIQELVEGEDLEDHFSGTQAEYDEMSVELGRYIARMHQVKLAGFGRLEEYSLKGRLQGSQQNNKDYIELDLATEVELLARAELIKEKLAEKILGYFRSNQRLSDINEASVVHYDIADHNIMFEKGKITGLIDWEAVVASDPVLDIASMPTWKTHYPRLEKFLQGYKQVADLPDNFDDKFAYYQLRTILWKTVFCMKTDILTPERFARLETALQRAGIS